MLILIENLIDEATVARLRGWLSEATFEDGRATAGGSAALVKRNEQVSSDPSSPDPKLEEMQSFVEDLLWDHDLFNAAAQPKEILSPIFSRYSPGMSYGTHMDNALMGGMRIDMSLTLFLSDPSTYDGGELIIDFATGQRAIKLPAGSAVLYATTAPHRVAEVTRGQRLAVVTWVRSFVRDPAAREILLDLKTTRDRLSTQIESTQSGDIAPEVVDAIVWDLLQTLDNDASWELSRRDPERLRHSVRFSLKRKAIKLQTAALSRAPEIDLLSKTYTNLLRRWSED